MIRTEDIIAATGKRRQATHDFAEATLCAVDGYGARTASDVARITGIAHAYASQMLILLARKGRIERVFYGEYTTVKRVVLPPPVPPVEPVKPPESIIRPLSRERMMGAHLSRKPNPAKANLDGVAGGA